MTGRENAVFGGESCYRSFAIKWTCRIDFRSMALTLLCFGLVHPFSHAQVDTGAIVGDGRADSSGASIADATVIVTEEGTGRKRTVQTASDGSYIISPLKLGAYTLTAEKQGFKTTVQAHVQVTIQARLEINPELLRLDRFRRISR